MSEKLRSKLEDLKANISGCCTRAGVQELEQLYATKRKELGDKITPMMDIMVRDTFTGKYADLENSEKVAKETEEANALAKRKIQLDIESKEQKAKETNDTEEKVQENSVQSYRDFVRSDTMFTEQSVNVAVISFANMNPPTTSDQRLMQCIDKVSDKVHGLQEVYLSHAHGSKSPLTYTEQLDFVRKMAPESNIVESNHRTLLEAVAEMPGRGISEIYLVCYSGQTMSHKIAGEWFLARGGDNYTVVEVSETANVFPEMSKDELMEKVQDGDFEGMLEERIADVEGLYEKLERVGYGSF